MYICYYGIVERQEKRAADQLPTGTATQTTQRPESLPLYYSRDRAKSKGVLYYENLRTNTNRQPQEFLQQGKSAH